MEIKLINSVRKHPCLYDMKSRHYRDNKIRQEAWEEIANQMSSTANTVKVEWGKLRNAYSSALNRRKVKTGQAATIITPWKFEKEMAFLNPLMEMRNSFTNLQTPDEMQEENANEMTYEEIKETQNVKSNNLIKREPSTPLHNFSKFRKTNPAQEIINIIEETPKQHNIRYEESVNKTQDLDETDMFYLSMSKTVKNLPPIDQAKIRMQLCQLVSEAEIRMLEGCSGLQFTSSSSESH